MCWIFELFWHLNAILMRLNFGSQILSISLVYIFCSFTLILLRLQSRWLKIINFKQHKVIILEVVLSFSNVQRYMFRLMAQESSNSLCLTIRFTHFIIYFYFWPRWKSYPPLSRRISISNSFRWWCSIKSWNVLLFYFSRRLLLS